MAEGTTELEPPSKHMGEAETLARIELIDPSGMFVTGS